MEPTPSPDISLKDQYNFQAVLDREGLYELYWSYDLEEETISFAVRVKTEGWVGFGLSPNGQMPGSDVVIGWVDNQGNAYLHVSYGPTSLVTYSNCSHTHIAGPFCSASS